MKIIALIAVVTLVGCGTQQPEIRYQNVEVKVPVMVPVPPPADVTRPDLIINTLTLQDQKDPGKVVTAYKATVKQLEGYTLQLEDIVDGYRKLSKGQPNESK